jgi:hypothetical protein
MYRPKHSTHIYYGLMDVPHLRAQVSWEQYRMYADVGRWITKQLRSLAIWCKIIWQVVPANVSISR